MTHKSRGRRRIIYIHLEGKRYKKNFQEHDVLRDSKMPPFSSLLRCAGEKGGNFESRKNRAFESCTY